MTSVSIQDAFLQLLLEKDYESISMRDIANVSGVSIGGLYHYFPSKDAIAAMTVRSWVRKLSLALAAAVGTESRPMDATVRLLVQTMVSTMFQGIDKWRALTVLERRISPLPVYKLLYMHHVHLFQGALASATDWPPDRPGGHEAFNAYTLLDSLMKQTLLVRAPCPSADRLTVDIACAVSGYLYAALAMEPHSG